MKMGRRDKKPSQASSDDILSTLGDFTSKENWDKFFSIRSGDNPFEWYAEWADLRDPLLSLLSEWDNSSSSIRILVPGCGNSKLSEYLYDSGFKNVTNIDFSKVVISDMLRRNVRDRPGMRWRVMDMTAMQFEDETFHVVLDKGGLDALMEPQLGPKLGNQYLLEVRRVLISGGKFICLTLAESHVLDSLFSLFRFGWKMSISVIEQRQSRKPGLCTFVVVLEKEALGVLHQVTVSFDKSSLACSGDQAVGFLESLENENRIRREYSNGREICYSMEYLRLGAFGDLVKLRPGCRFKLTLGGQGESRFSYRAVVLDARKQSGPFSYHCGVFIVPNARAHEWLFSSEEGQWMVVDSSKAARLVMVILDGCHSSVGIDEIQKDLSPLVKKLSPGTDTRAQIPFMMASDGIKQRNIVHEVVSLSTGPIVVEDVIYENVDPNISRLLPSNDSSFRRLVFKRAEGLVQSEALLTRDESSDKIAGVEKRNSGLSSKSKRKENKRSSTEKFKGLKVCHDYLSSSYHMGIISGFTLIAPYMQAVASGGKLVNTVVVGLGAGLLPMFLHQCMPFLHIEVVELDHEVYTLATDCFAFKENEHLKVHIADGVKFVREIKDSVVSSKSSSTLKNGDSSSSTKPSINGNCAASCEVKGSRWVDILVIDVDSSDSSSGMSCPAADFVEESFLKIVKDTLSEQGLFIINLVTRSSAVKDMVISRMKVVFKHLFCLQLDEDVNMILFGLSSESCIKQDNFTEAALQLEKLIKLKDARLAPIIKDTAMNVKSLI